MLNFTLLGRVSWKIADGGLRWFVISFYYLVLFFVELFMFSLTNFEWEQCFYIKICQENIQWQGCMFILFNVGDVLEFSFVTNKDESFFSKTFSAHTLQIRSTINQLLFSTMKCIYCCISFPILAIKMCTVYVASHLTCS